MRVFAKSTLRTFWENSAHRDSEGPLKAGYAEVDKADWKNFADVRRTFGTASAVGNDRVVFNIGGNKYRLIARVNYGFAGVLVRFIGTHAEYDNVNAETI
jgi:mRNA interferase HigB